MTEEAREKPVKLTTKQRAFIERYLGNGFNASEAARHVGYSHPRTAGAQNLAKTNISTEIRRRLSEAAMSADEVLGRLANHARGDMADFLRVDEEEVTLAWSVMPAKVNAEGQVDLLNTTVALAQQGQVKPTDVVLHTATVKRSVARLDLLEAGQNGKLHLIKKYTIDKEGKVTIELYDAQAALEKLGKAHGLFNAFDWSKVPQPILDALASGKLTVDDLKRLATQSAE